MDLSLQIQFAEVYAQFLNNEHNLNTIGKLIEIVRENRYKLSSDAMRTMLQIPLCVLEECVEIKDEIEWAKENGSYFSGNCVGDEYYITVYQSEAYTLNTIAEHLRDIMDNDDKLRHSFCLRISEVTISRDANVKRFSNFGKCGPIFAKVMEKAFEL